jgi:hypothetical protein
MKIDYPDIYSKCLEIAYREADDRIVGAALNETIVTAANGLYALIVGAGS